MKIQRSLSTSSFTKEPKAQLKSSSLQYLITKMGPKSPKTNPKRKKSRNLSSLEKLDQLKLQSKPLKLFQRGNPYHRRKQWMKKRSKSLKTKKMMRRKK